MRRCQEGRNRPQFKVGLRGVIVGFGQAARSSFCSDRGDTGENNLIFHSHLQDANTAP